MDLINMEKASKEILKKCSSLYCEIWREPPWNENFWTQERVLRDMEEQIERPLFQGFIAIRREESIGFTWGYEVNALNLSVISGTSKSRWKEITSGKRTFYIDELGVDIHYRKQGIGERLTKALLKQNSNLGIIYITLRTDVKAEAARNLYQKLGFKEINVVDSEYPDRTYWLLSL